MSDNGRNPNGTFKKGFTGNRKGAPPKRKQVRTSLDILQDENFGPVAKDLPSDIAPEHEGAYRTLQAAFRGSKRARRQIAKHIIRRHEELVQDHDKRYQPQVRITLEPTSPRNADDALVFLQIAQDDGFDEKIGRRRLKLQSWAVQAAISRRHGGRRLTANEIEEIESTTAHAAQLKWPRGYR